MTLLDDLGILAEAKKVSRRIFRILENGIVEQLRRIEPEDDEDDDDDE